MIKTELLEFITNGENSGVEFKRDNVHPDDLAKEISALSNFKGGHIILGVEDDGTIAGLTKDVKDVEEWVMNICRNNMEQPIIPYWEVIHLEESKSIGIITLPSDMPDKPYRAKRGSHWKTYIRVGSTSRNATREEEARLFQASGFIRYDLRPVPGSSLHDLDRERLNNYFRHVRGQEVPPYEDDSAWEQILLNTELLVGEDNKASATIGGLLLFGLNPNRYLPQAGITATAYPGQTKGYETQEEEIIRGPLIPLLAQDGEVTKMGLIDRAINFVRRNMGTTSVIKGARRATMDSYPTEAAREAIVNAVAHRDYTNTVTDIEISLFSDRLEIISPGSLPNTVTVEKMKQGCRAARNELLKEVLRDYDYIEHRGMGVPYKLIAGMKAHNGTEPDLIAEETRFIVALWKNKT